MNLLRHTSFWTPQVMTCSALKNINIDTVWGMLVDYRQKAVEEGAFEAKRAQQNRDWMHQLVNEMLLMKLSQNTEIKDYKLLSGLSSFKESSFEDTVPKTAMKKPIIEPEEEINSNDTRSPTKYIQLQNVLAANKRADLLQYSQSQLSDDFQTTIRRDKEVVDSQKRLKVSALRNINDLGRVEETTEEQSYSREQPPMSKYKETKIIEL